MTGDAGNGKPIEVFVQGISHAVDGSGRVSFGLSDVVIALSVGKKDDGSLPSSGVAEETAAAPFGGDSDVSICHHDAVVVKDFYKKFYNSLGRVPNHYSSSIGKTRGLLSFSKGIGWEGLITV
ncbi:hypothetical protein Tco_1099927 [Tanacetum coccineum]